MYLLALELMFLGVQSTLSNGAIANAGSVLDRPIVAV